MSGYSHSFSMVDDDVDADVIGSGMGPLADSIDSSAALESSGGAGVDSSSVHNNSSSHLLSGLVSQAEHVLTVTSRLKNTLTCIVLYIVLMCLNLFVMVWELSGRGYHPLILAVEFFINLFILLEVGLGIFGMGRAYFDSLMNRIDAFLACACIAFFLLLVIGTKGKEDSGFVSEVDAVLLALRFLFQVLRLSVLIYRSRKVALMQIQEEVNFNAINIEACVSTEETNIGGGGDGRTEPIANERKRRFSASGMHQAFEQINGLSGEEQDITAASTSSAVGSDDTAGTVASANGRNGHEHVNDVASTSYIHLKPSIFLELQNARVFADAQPPTIAMQPMQPHSSNGSSPPLLTSPLSPESLLQQQQSNPSTPLSASVPSSACSSTTSSLSGAGSKRTLHPLLANDSELEEFEDDLNGRTNITR